LHLFAKGHFHSPKFWSFILQRPEDHLPKNWSLIHQNFGLSFFRDLKIICQKIGQSFAKILVFHLPKNWSLIRQRSLSFAKNLVMPCPLYQRYLRFVSDATNDNSEAFKDLPPLECPSCGKCTHFGGSQTLAEKNFTLNDVCGCGISEYFSEG